MAKYKQIYKKNILHSGIMIWYDDTIISGSLAQWWEPQCILNETKGYVIAM